ncbi:MAG: GtrA family protein [Candidatus Methanoplasma sp.]|jgi:putative flippase GtrA|nr:GtrA family protein [Candidatus Methanoplasma sp.]
MDSFTDIFKKYREGILYLVCGAGTIIVSWLTYALFVWIDIDVSASNILSWVCAVSFAFVVNKWIVFLSRSLERDVLVKEIGSFFFMRIMTGLVAIAAFPALYYGLGMNMPLFSIDGLAAKITVSVVEIILNYFASKFVVFKTKSEDSL